MSQAGREEDWEEGSEGQGDEGDEEAAAPDDGWPKAVPSSATQIMLDAALLHTRVLTKVHPGRPPAFAQDMMSLDKNWKALPEDEMRKLLRTLNKPSFKKIVDEATKYLVKHGWYQKPGPQSPAAPAPSPSNTHPGGSGSGSPGRALQMLSVRQPSQQAQQQQVPPSPQAQQQQGQVPPKRAAAGQATPGTAKRVRYEDQETTKKLARQLQAYAVVWTLRNAVEAQIVNYSATASYNSILPAIGSMIEMLGNQPSTSASTSPGDEMINILTSMMTGQVSLEALQRLYNFLRDYFN